MSALQSRLLHAAVSCWRALRRCVPLHGLVAARDPRFARVCCQLCWTLSHLLSVFYLNLSLWCSSYPYYPYFVGGVVFVVVLLPFNFMYSSFDEPAVTTTKLPLVGIITVFFNFNLNIISLNVFFAISHFIGLYFWHCFIIFAWLLWNCF